MTELSWPALRAAAVAAAGAAYAPYSRLHVGAAALCDDGRMVTGTPTQVVKRLRELAEQAQVDELVSVTPSIDRARRTASLEALAVAGWSPWPAVPAPASC